MYVGRDFPPMTQNESLTLGLDFIDDVQPGSQILNSVWFMSVVKGVDPNPSSHLQGPSFIYVTSGNAVPTATKQRIGGLLPGVTYATLARVQTDFGDTFELHSHVTGISIK
jgi:hypothetical protein